MGAPGMALSESERVESGLAKFLDRWLRMGVRRSSSSRRGRARAASCIECHGGEVMQRWELHTSNPLSSLSLNPARTIFICSLTGTYAFPRLRKILRVSTSSGTVSKSTLNQPPSSTSCFLKPGVAFMRSAANVRFSSSDTTSQFSCSDSTKACLSRASSF